jgi:sugar lactone lactonase YvrE
LAWTVANATSLSLNQGLGAVTGASISVNPLVSTIYTLTASNANGTVNQSTTVTVQTSAHNLSFLAGDLGGYGNLDGPGSAARFCQPKGVVCDASGNAWVVDGSNHSIRKIAPDGTVSTFAGSPGVSGSADGTGASARFQYPDSLALDGSGNLYVSDTSNHTIRKITPAGAVTTLAGSPGQPGAVNGNGSNARFNYPRGLAVDGAGNLFVADRGNHAIRKVTPSGEVSTFAGTLGQSGFAEGAEGVARLYHPVGLTMDGSGNLFVADTDNNSIRKITSGGVVSTFAGTSQGGHVDDTGAAARFLVPTGIAIDPAGNLFVSEGVDTIRKVTPSAEVTTLAGAFNQEGASDGPGGSARFYYPAGLAWDAAAGRLLVADSYNDSIRTVTPGGLVGTLAGSPPLKGSQDGLGSAARFNVPMGVAADSTGQLFVAEMANETIRKVALDGTVSTFVGSAGQNGDADGTGSAARFRYPQGVALDGAGNLLICEAGGARIRKVSPAGVVSTLAGAYPGGGSTDGPGTVARFNSPAGIAVDTAGNAYVTDRLNFTLRKITPAGEVSTLAGTAGQSGFTDGSGAAARFAEPTGIALDSAGNVYVADQSNHTLRRITPGGTVSTLAGSPGLAGSTDGTGAAARFNHPYALALDPVSGNLLVGDTDNSTIRVVTPAGVVTTLAGQPGKQGILLGALPGVISSALGIARLPDGRFVFTAANGLIVLKP